MRKILELIAAVSLGVVFLPIGMLYNIIVIITLKLRFFKQFFRIFKEIILVVLDFCRQIAVIIDRLGNVILGTLFIHIFVKKKYRYKTLFGFNNITISAAFGHSYEWIYLRKSGVKFAKMLDIVFGKNHCKDAYQWHLIKKEFNNDNTTGI